MWAERVTGTALAEQLLREGLRHGRASSRRWLQSWRDWAADPDGWISVPHGELVARVGLTNLPTT